MKREVLQTKINEKKRLSVTDDDTNITTQADAALDADLDSLHASVKRACVVFNCNI